MSTLYIVATPIGNLGDLTARVSDVLGAVDIVAAEDTRRSGQLLAHLGINRKLVALHSHNESAASENVLQWLKDGQSVALLSDAGTPLISDPGYELVRLAQQAGVHVVPVAGPSAVTTALSVSGIPCNTFAFDGFVPAKSSARKQFYQGLMNDPRTIVVFEAPHRISDSIADLAESLGQDKEICICRELTKTYEQIVRGPAGDIAAMIESAEIPARGEFVLVIAPGEVSGSIELDSTLRVLLKDLPTSKAASIAARLTGTTKSEAYDRAEVLKQLESNQS